MIEPPHLFKSLVDAARAFNSAQYFETHEILEDALDDVPDELWDLFVGLIQIAVGYHKVTQDLRSGAAGMLARGLEKVAAFPDEVAGIKLEPLRARARADHEALLDGTFSADGFVRQPPRLQLVKASD